MSGYANDLFVLVADSSMEQAFEGLLAQRQRLGARQIGYDIEVHPQHDPGCRKDAASLLRPRLKSHRYALVVFDRHGCGSTDSRERLQQKVERNFARNGWENRCKAIVIEPELENWIWAPSGEIAEILRWGNDFDLLREWLHEQKLWTRNAPKPADPKRAMQEALRRKRVRRSPRLFNQVAHVALLDAESCTDPAFVELKETLQAWFP